jgi:hypothetical protein
MSRNDKTRVVKRGLCGFRALRLPAITTAATTTAAATTAAAAIVATAATAAAATAIPTTTTTAAAATAGGTILSDVHAKRTALEVLAIEIIERLLGTLLRRHLDEAEAARAASHPVQHQSNFANLATCSETLGDQVLGGVKRKVTNVQTIRHFGTFLSRGSNIRENHPQPLGGRILRIALNENAPG